MLSLSVPLNAVSFLWRVDATAASGETATTGRIGPVVVPAWATLTSLSNLAGLVIDTAQPTLTWRPVGVATAPGPLTFDLDVQRAATGITDVNVANLIDKTFR